MGCLAVTHRGGGGEFNSNGEPSAPQGDTVNAILLTIIVLCLACIFPELTGMVVALFLIYCFGNFLFHWAFDPIKKYLPKIPKAKVPYKQAAKQVYHHSYRKQKDRRGPIFALAHMFLIISIAVTLFTYYGIIEDIKYTIQLWLLTIILFLVWYLWKKGFPKVRPLPGRQRR